MALVLGLIEILYKVIQYQMQLEKLLIMELLMFQCMPQKKIVNMIFHQILFTLSMIPAEEGRIYPVLQKEDLGNISKYQPFSG